MSMFLELCEIEPRLEALRQEALEIASWSGGSMNQIRDLWHGRQNQPGLKTSMIKLLRSDDVADELKDRSAYTECYQGLWQTVCSTRGMRD